MQFDILDPYLHADDPYPVYSWLRSNAPLYWDEKNRFWIVSKYEDVAYVSKHPKLFCSRQGVMADSDIQISIVTMDDPRHTQLRSLISRGFTPRMVGNLGPRIHEIVTASIDAVVAKGACDFVSDLAVPLPLLVIADMIGIRPEDREVFWEWSDTMILAAGQNNNPQVVEKAREAYVEYAGYLEEIFEDRRRHPQDDLVSILVAAETEGRLTSNQENIRADELLQFMTLLLVAGNETTRNAISGGLLTLIEHPQERARLQARPDLMPVATEEILRWVSPIIAFRRTATQDTELRGHRIRAGEHVLLLYPSANRDEDAFDEPDRFRIDRDPNDHLAFGIGTHYCLGANLARLEIRIMMEVLRRLPDIDLAPGSSPVRVPSPLVRAIGSMPVVFRPQPQEMGRGGGGQPVTAVS